MGLKEGLGRRALLLFKAKGSKKKIYPHGVCGGLRERLEQRAQLGMLNQLQDTEIVVVHQKASEGIEWWHIWRNCKRRLSFG